MWSRLQVSSFRDWLRSKKRHDESLVDTAQRMIVVIAYTETVAKGQRQDAMADWLDLPHDRVQARRVAVGRLIRRHIHAD